MTERTVGPAGRGPEGPRREPGVRRADGRAVAGADDRARRPTAWSPTCWPTWTVGWTGSGRRGTTGCCGSAPGRGRSVESVRDRQRRGGWPTSLATTLGQEVPDAFAVELDLDLAAPVPDGVEPKAAQTRIEGIRLSPEPGAGPGRRGRARRAAGAGRRGRGRSPPALRRPDRAAGGQHLGGQGRVPLGQPVPRRHRRPPGPGLRAGRADRQAGRGLHRRGSRRAPALGLRRRPAPGPAPGAPGLRRRGLAGAGGGAAPPAALHRAGGRGRPRLRLGRRAPAPRPGQPGPRRPAAVRRRRGGRSRAGRPVGGPHLPDHRAGLGARARPPTPRARRPRPPSWAGSTPPARPWASRPGPSTR